MTTKKTKKKVTKKQPARKKQTVKKVLPPLPEKIQFFRYDNLSEPLQILAKPFADIAKTALEALPDNPQKDIALQKLLECKDAMLRVAVYKKD